MTAAELKQMADQFHAQPVQLPKNLLDQLSRAAQAGSYFLDYYSWITPSEQRELRKQGFDVQQRSFNSDDYFHISWAK